jgi:hypothetical protein
MRRIHRKLLAAAILSFVAQPAVAQSAVAQTAEAEPEDKSGTNPAKLNRTFSIGNDFRWLDKGRWSNQTTFRYSEPFAGDTMSLSVKAPVAWTNAAGGKTMSGLGDISAKWTWVAYLDRRQGLVLSAEVAAPTAAENILGTGKWTVAPGATYAAFLSPEFIIAPALVYVSSFAGDRQRSSVSRLDFDLYAVYRPKGKRWWVTQDLTISHDFMTRKWPASYKVALGLNLGKIGDAAVNLSLRPGIGLGVDKPFRYSFEVGLSVVGF